MAAEMDGANSNVSQCVYVAFSKSTMTDQTKQNTRDVEGRRTVMVESKGSVIERSCFLLICI